MHEAEDVHVISFVMSQGYCMLRFMNAVCGRACERTAGSRPVRWVRS